MPTDADTTNPEEPAPSGDAAPGASSAPGTRLHTHAAAGVLVLSGWLTSTSAADAREAIRAAAAAQPDLLIDATAVSQIDRAGLAMLVSAATRLRAGAGGPGPVIAAAGSPVARAFTGRGWSALLRRVNA